MGWCTIVLLLGLVAAPTSAAERVARVIDGDTIRMESGEVIRMLGVDAPEYGHHARCAAERDLAARARHLVVVAVEGGVDLERRRRDRYGRTLARVTVAGLDLALALIELGLGRPYRGERRVSWCG